MPKPFGSSLSNSNSLNWWHDYYSFVYVSSTKWAVVKESGAVTRFTPCLGIPCMATPSGGSLSKRERLQRTSTGFILTDANGRKRYFEAKHIETGGSRERYFLSRIVARNGAQEAVLTYAAPSGLICPAGSTGSTAGVPYLSSVATPSSALDFQYAQLISSFGTECVVRSLTRRGESAPGVMYTYAQDSSSVERPGLLAQATLASKTLAYSYLSSALEASVGTVLVTRHDYAASVGGAPPAVSVASAPGEQLTLGALTTSTCQPGSDCCGVQPQSRTATDAFAGRGDGLSGASGFVRIHETLTNAAQTTSPRLYQTTDSCTTAGACSPGTDRYEWTCAAGGLPAHEKARKDKRNFWEVYTHAPPASGTGMPASMLERTSVKRGASDMTGTGALEEESFSYTYGPQGEQLLASSEKPSLLGTSGQKARTFHRYDSTGRLEATIQSGWTRVFDSATGAWSSQQRWIGTFFFTTRTGESTPDALGRTLEQHGPCLVVSEAATDCPSAPPFPLTRNYYWADTETSPRRNQLRKVATYPAGPSSTAIETAYNAYDASGHITESVDANGVTTLSTYQDNLLLTQAIRVTGQPDVVTTYGYDAAGQQTSILYPEGNYEVFCYRQGTSSGCAGGTLTNKLQWKAKSASSTAASWSEKVTYSYWPDGTLNEERYLDASGNTRKVLSYAADAHKRTTWQKTGSGMGSFISTKGYDASNNLSGEGKAFNSPPAWCAVDSTGLPTSAACSAMLYDGANRLLRLDEHPTSSTTTRTCFKHDAHGNLTSVDVGVPATTDCATATPSAKASHYQSDDFGNLVEATLAATSTSPIRFTYNAQGSLLVKQTPAMAAAHVRDHLGYTYDAMGRLLSASHFSPLVTGGAEGLYAMAYDSSASIHSSCGSLSNTLGRILFRDDSFGRTWLSYDAWGRTLKEVRLRTGTTSCSGTTPYQAPHTLYTYSLNGNLTQVTHPYGRTVSYSYGSGALTDRISSVNVLTYGTGGTTTSTPLISQAAWEPYGSLRGYRTHYASSGTAGSVEYAFGDNASSSPSSCPASAPSISSGDATGRIRALWVSSLASGASFTPGSGNGAVLKQLYTWQADQLVRADSCLLGASSPRTETYGYDGQLRLTSASGTLSTQGGAFTSRALGFDSRGNRTSESGEANSWSLTYYFRDQLSWRDSTQSNSKLGRHYSYDADGRVTAVGSRSGTGALGGVTAFFIDFGVGPSASGATDTVFKSATVNGLTYNYFYDALGKRRLKSYPTGISDEYFHNLDQGMLVDQGNLYTFASTIHPVDEYVWLDGRPIALVRGKLDTSWAHLSDNASDCSRLGEAASCGIYHLVTDYLGKPVLMLDSQGRVTGTGEYDTSGHVNRVSVDFETAHPYSTATAAFGGIMKQPAVAGTSLQQRILFDSFDLFDESVQCTLGESADRSDTLHLKDVASNSNLLVMGPWDTGVGRAWSSWLTPGTSGISASINNTGIAFCSAGYDCSGIQCLPVCTCFTNQTTKKNQGAIISAYEYRRFQTGAAPFWTPLRLPGQYHDVETDLFENWNRFYDPSIGGYLQPEPLLKDPRWVASSAKRGTASVSTYAYGASNPVHNTDPSGLYTLAGYCQNWDQGLRRARQVAGCREVPEDTDDSCECQKALDEAGLGDCDICEILTNGTWPVVDIGDRDSKKDPLPPRPISDLPWGYTDLGPDGIRVRGVRFRAEACLDTEELARTMLHEAAHVCSERVRSRVGEYTPGGGARGIETKCFK
ncbi:RHS repeat-associated core domain-containing protein [Myxococcus sp. CA033]|uniref:RHS repeat-associated core domain-containing protein n=1 Tax=Myxococcus sp. CA033 TaxID=2741516 RepID=UPI00157B64F5|nr:RHS repeat-associated core domain-containing protein [Myxococcus sp. CA033]NTX35868.1 RHS repeat-associated core domain-containing protein [Myxococcus sp. CA033]